MLKLRADYTWIYSLTGGRDLFPREDEYLIRTAVLLPTRRGSRLLTVSAGNQIPAFCVSSPSPGAAWETHPGILRPLLCLFVFPSRLTAWTQTAPCLLFKLSQVKTSCHRVLSISVLHTHTHYLVSLELLRTMRKMAVPGHCPLPSTDTFPSFISDRICTNRHL